jgi:hypothetical protein
MCLQPSAPCLSSPAHLRAVANPLEQ